MRSATVVAVALWGLAGPAVASPLSFKAVSFSEVSVFFDVSGPGLVAISDGNVTVPLGAGTTNLHLNTRVWEGRTGTAAVGLFLYDYWLEGETNTREFFLDFAPLVPFELRGFGGSADSHYCSDCTTSPVPTPPNGSDLTGSVLTFFFNSGFDPFSTHFYVISSLGPGNATAKVRVFETGNTTYDLSALAPVPEPAPLVLLALTLFGLVTRRRRL